MSTFLILVLLVFLATLVHASVLGVWRDRLLRMEVTRPEPTSPGPSISVVVPARNAERTITFLLQDLHEQTLSKERYEVIVVDDASTDGTAVRVRSMATRWPGLQVVPAEGQGKKAAITTGVGRAHHAWVLVTDADVRCGRERLDVFARHLGATEDVLVGGPVRMTHRSGLPGTLQAEETAALQGATLGSGIGGRPVLLNGANMAFRKEVFERMGGYAGDRWASGDDVFLLERIVDVAADEMGIDPVELRRRNFIPKDAFPYQTPVALQYDSGDYFTTLEMATKAADYAGFEARRAEAARRASNPA